MVEQDKIKLPILRCLRCGHSWIPRKVDMPRTCPKCRSAYWDKPRLNLPKAEFENQLNYSGGREVGKAD